ncbi:hypothetical protein OIO90_000581 [Microbotryomycetes sp. JL221]|nr:hypothetical protein OIO90_000581 [Microbotryomycetes sp. JL221]
MAVLIVSALDDVLRQLVSATHTPHTALVVSIPAGNVIASQTTADDPAPKPFPPHWNDDIGASRADNARTGFAPSDDHQRQVLAEHRARAFAAVVTSMWTQERLSQTPLQQSHRGASASSSSALKLVGQDGSKLAPRDEIDPLMLDTEIGRIAAIQMGAFLLVLVGSRVTPWPVLDTKIRVAQEALNEPLNSVSA